MKNLKRLAKELMLWAQSGKWKEPEKLVDIDDAKKKFHETLGVSPEMVSFVTLQEINEAKKDYHETPGVIAKVRYTATRKLVNKDEILDDKGKLTKLEFIQRRWLRGEEMSDDDMSWLLRGYALLLCDQIERQRKLKGRNK